MNNNLTVDKWLEELSQDRPTFARELTVLARQNMSNPNDFMLQKHNS